MAAPMRSLYLSAPIRLQDLPGTEEDVAASYRAAYAGVVLLCEQDGWQVHHSREAGDRAEGWLRGSDAFVALRFAGVKTALMAGWELMNAVGKAPSGQDRAALVFKLEPTEEFDEYWLGKLGATGVVGDPQKLLEHLEHVLRA